MSPKWLAVLGLTGLVSGTPYTLAQTAPSLGEAASFAVLAGAAVRNTGATTITGNVGGKTITGSPIVKVGAIRNDLAQRAQKDAASAYDTLAALPCLPLQGDPVPPGVYCVSQLLRGTLTLDAGGNADAVWIFRAPTLTTDPDTLVRMINGGCEHNVFWQVAQSATLGAETTFVGNILAQGDITFGAGASLSGRALALGRSSVVSLDNNNVSLCCELITIAPATLSDAKAGSQYSPVTLTATGGTGSYTFRVAANGKLPNGLSLSEDGAISGKAIKAGDSTFTVIATDRVTGCTGDQTYDIHVQCDPAVTISPAALSPGIIGVKYYTQIIARPGTFDYSTKGDPSEFGMHLSPDGTLSGTPNRLGVFVITVTATEKTSGCSGTIVYVFPVICPVITIAPLDPDTAIVGQPYQGMLNASGGTSPYTFDVPAATRPAWLDPPQGKVITGTPTTPDVYRFPVMATDANGCSVTQIETVTVLACPTFTLSPATLPPATAGVPYAATFKAIPGSFVYTATGLPPNALNPVTGMLNLPNPQAPSIAFTVTAAEQTTKCSISRAYTLGVVCAPIVLAASLPGGTVGMFYSQSLIASGGAPPLAITISGSLPPGLAPTSAGMLAGPPTTAGSYCFSASVTDNNGCAAGPVDYKVIINGPSCPAGTIITLSPATLPPAQTGMPYSQFIVASGGTGSYTYSAGILPPGLILNSVTGELSGTPTAPGNYAFPVMATDANGCIGTIGCNVPLVVDIPAFSPLSMALLSLLLATIGAFISRKERRSEALQGMQETP